MKELHRIMEKKRSSGNMMHILFFCHQRLYHFVNTTKPNTANRWYPQRERLCGLLLPTCTRRRARLQFWNPVFCCYVTEPKSLRSASLQPSGEWGRPCKKARL